MAFKAKLSTKGFEEYLERVKSAGLDIDVVADEALLAGGEVLLEGMRRRAPVETGHLRDSLVTVGPKQDGNYHFIEVGLVGADAETARYGTAQEYGTSSMGASPYIRPTMDADMKKARQAMREVYKEVLGE